MIPHPIGSIIPSCDSRILAGVLAAGAALLAAGCAGDATRFDRELIATELTARAGHGVAPRPATEGLAIPDGVSLEDGLDEDEAVALALWNNPEYQESLAALAFARADIIQAGLLSNPGYSVLFPVDSKKLEFAVGLPIEALLLRPRRLAAAELDAERTAALLVEEGLALVERVRAAWEALRLARTRADEARLDAEIAEEVAAHQAERLRAGDASEYEASLARVAALEARETNLDALRDARLRALELRQLVGLAPHVELLPDESSGSRPTRPGGAFDLDRDEPLDGALAAPLDRDVDTLVELAGRARPALRAAGLDVEAAAARASLSRWEIIRITALLDANDTDDSDLELGPGIEGTIPIFDWNQGGTARAAAELERAALALAAARRRVAAEIAQARVRLEDAAARHLEWRERILPELEDAVRRAERAAKLGATSRLPALQTRQRLVAARTQAAAAEAAARTALAALERAVGVRLDDASIEALLAATDSSSKE